MLHSAVRELLRMLEAAFAAYYPLASFAFGGDAFALCLALSVVKSAFVFAFHRHTLASVVFFGDEVAMFDLSCRVRCSSHRKRGEAEEQEG